MLTSSRNVQYFTCLGFNPILPAVFRALETRTKERSNRVVPLPPSTHSTAHPCEIAAIFFPSRFSFTDTDDSQDSRRREGTIFYSTLSLPPSHEHLDIYL